MNYHSTRNPNAFGPAHEYNNEQILLIEIAKFLLTKQVESALLLL